MEVMIEPRMRPVISPIGQQQRTAHGWISAASLEHPNVKNAIIPQNGKRKTVIGAVRKQQRAKLNMPQICAQWLISSL